MNILNLLKQALLSGLGVPIVLLMMLMMVILPMPAIMLDMLFTFNISLSLIVLLVVVYSMRPLDFSVFPTVLLIATMLRLALNIASTRVVLIDGHTGSAAAGNVIKSFGEFVIGGNYAVGIIVFAILVIINFIVVTKGAGRVSEVTARFTLDAMPGKQMAIDADINSGIITHEEAKERREEIAKEADFYGAMDGSSKFVRGDAVAGILILFMNVIGGLIIGTSQHNLSFSVAAESYVLLTVGDGLVAQIPSLLLSVATAIIVTRVSSSQDMNSVMGYQLFSQPRVLMVAAAVMGFIGAIPGMPNMVFLSFAAFLAFMSFKQKTKQDKPVEEVEHEAPEEAPTSNELNWNEIKPLDIIALDVGFRLIPLLDASQGGKMVEQIRNTRRKISQDLGFLIHSVHVRDNLDIQPNAYKIYLLGVPEGEGMVYPDKLLAIDSGAVIEAMPGIQTKDPAFNMNAVWVEHGQKDQATSSGYTVVDPNTVILTHLSQIINQSAHHLFGYQEAQQLLDTLAVEAPKLVEDLIPKLIPLATFVRVLQNLLEEKISIRNIRTIAETLADQAQHTQDAEHLTAAVRIALKRHITQDAMGLHHELTVMTLDNELEQLLLQSLSSNQESGGIGMEPDFAERLFSSIAEVFKQQEIIGNSPVLLVSPVLRSWLAKLITHSIPGLRVLAYNEISENKKIKIIATIGNELSRRSVGNQAA